MQEGGVAGGGWGIECCEACGGSESGRVCGGGSSVEEWLGKSSNACGYHSNHAYAVLIGILFPASGELNNGDEEITYRCL